MELHERIIWSRKEVGMAKQDDLLVALNKFLKEHGEDEIAQATLSRLESGHRKASALLVPIALITGVMVEWLIYGIGPRIGSNDQEWESLGKTLEEEKKEAIKLLFQDQ